MSQNHQSKTKKLFLSGYTYNKEVNDCEHVEEIWFNKKSNAKSINDVCLKFNGLDPDNCQIQDLAFINSATLDQSINNINDKGQHFSIIKYAKELLFGSVEALNQFVSYAIDRNYKLGKYWNFEELDDGITIVLYNLPALSNDDDVQDIEVYNKLTHRFKKVKFYITQQKYFELVLKIYVQQPNVTLKFQRLDVYMQNHLDFIIKNIENIQIYILNVAVVDFKGDAQKIQQILTDNSIMVLWYKTIKDQFTANKMLSYYNIANLKIIIDRIEPATIYQIIEHNGMQDAITLICNSDKKENLHKLLAFPPDYVQYLKKVKITFDAGVNYDVETVLRNIFNDKLVIEPNQYIYEQFIKNNFIAWDQYKKSKLTIKTLQSQNQSLKQLQSGSPVNNNQSLRLSYNQQGKSSQVLSYVHNSQNGNMQGSHYDGQRSVNSSGVRQHHDKDLTAQSLVINNKRIKIKFEDGEIDEDIVNQIKGQFGDRVKVSKQDQIDDLKEQVKTLKNQNLNIQRQLNLVLKEKDDMDYKQFVEDIQGEVDKARQDHQAQTHLLSTQIQALTTLSKQLQTQYDKSRQEANELKQQIIMIQQQLSNEQTEKQQLMRSIDVLRQQQNTQFGTLQEQIKQQALMIQNQSKQITGYKNYIQAMQNLTKQFNQIE